MQPHGARSSVGLHNVVTDQSAKVPVGLAIRYACTLEASLPKDKVGEGERMRAEERKDVDHATLCRR